MRLINQWLKVVKHRASQRKTQSAGLTLAFEQQHSSACGTRLGEGGRTAQAGAGLTAADTQDGGWRKEAGNGHPDPKVQQG